MSDELAKTLREARLFQQARHYWGKVTSEDPLRVLLDGAAQDVGPLPFVRGRPEFDEKVLVIEGIESQHSYTVLGKRVVTGVPCGTPDTACTDYHWPTGTTVGTYTLSGTNRLVIPIYVADYRRQYVELIATDAAASPFWKQARVRIYCPNSWDGDPDTSPAPVSDVTGFLYYHPPIAFDDFLRANWNPSGMNGNWKIVIDGIGVEADEFELKRFGAACCAGPSAMTFSAHVTIPPDPAGTTLPGGFQNDRTRAEVWIDLGADLPDGITSMEYAVVWDDFAALDPYFGQVAGQKLTTVGQWQVQNFLPGRYWGRDVGLLGTERNFHFNEEPRDGSIPAIPYHGGSGDWTNGFQTGAFRYPSLFREDFPAGNYHFLFRTNGWALPQPPFDVGVTLFVTAHLCDGGSEPDWQPK